MSQTFFSKLDLHEKTNRLNQLAVSRGSITIWIKGQKDKLIHKALQFDKDHLCIVLDSRLNLFPLGSAVLCTFDLRGMTFFAQGVFRKSVGGDAVVEIKADLFKSERRNSYRLLTYPIYEVWAEFDLGEVYENGGKVIDFKTKSSSNTTDLFKNFLNIVSSEEGDESGKIKIRIQDLSTTGMSLHVGDIESPYFIRDTDFHNVKLTFQDEVIEIPEVKVVYIVDYISSDKNLKKYKVGLNFPKNTTNVDEVLGRKINQLLRDSDFNKDFENFLK